MITAARKGHGRGRKSHHFFVCDSENQKMTRASQKAVESDQRKT